MPSATASALPSIWTRCCAVSRLQPRTIPIDVIFDLNRMNMTYFPHFPRVQQALLPPTSRRKNAGGSDPGVLGRAGSRGGQPLLQLRHLQCLRQLLPGLSRALHRAFERSNGLYKILVDYCKGCRVCIEECPTGCLEGVPELDFDTGVVRMDTAFAISPGLHGRQAEQLKPPRERAPKNIYPAS